MSSASPADDPPRTPPQKGRVSELIAEASRSAAHSTPLRISTASTVGVAHKKDKVDSFLIREIRDMSLYTPADIWVEAVTGFSKDTVEQWAAVFRKKNLFQAAKIKKALRAFCGAKRETACYIPLSAILNYVPEFIAIHKADFLGLPATLEIKNVVYFRNDPNYLIALREQGVTT